MTGNPIMRFFEYGHLPELLQEVSKPFAVLAEQINERPTVNVAEQATALRKLLEAKDAAVRAALQP